MSDKNTTFTNQRDFLAISMAAASGEVTGRKWEVVLIGPEKPSDLVTIDGREWIRTKNNRFYLTDAIRRAFEAGLFENKKQYDNHLTEEEFEERGTMRSEDDWLGVYVDTRWDEAAKEGVATLQVVDDGFAGKLARAREAKVLNAVGLSVDVMRDGFVDEYKGEHAEFVTEIKEVNSIDSVMDAAGGGRYVRALEGKHDDKRSKEAMSPEQIASFKDAINASGLSDDAKSQMLAILDAEAGSEPASEQEEGAPEATVEEVVAEIEATIEVVADAALPPEVVAAVIEPLEEAVEEVEAAASEPERVVEMRRNIAPVRRVAEAMARKHKKLVLKAKVAKATKKPEPVAANGERGTESTQAATTEADAKLAEASKLVEKAGEIAKRATEATALAERKQYLDSKVEASGLPKAFQNLVADQFKGRQYPNKDLTRAIEAQRSALGYGDGGGEVVAHGYATSLQVGRVTEADRYQLNFIRKILGPTRFGTLVNMLHNKDKTDRPIFGALRKSGQLRAFEAWEKDGKPDLPSLVGGLREWYVSLTGDIMGVGEFHDRRAIEANITTSTVSSIVKNAVNLLLVFEYSQKDQWWADIVFEEDVDTIDDATLIRLFAASTLPIISEGAVYTELDFEDEEETAIFVKRGGYIGVTLETFLRDKVSGLRNIAPRLADSWYSTVGSKVAAVFTTNTAAGPVLADSGALFNATAASSATGHANLLTAALSPAALTAVVTAMVKQTDQPLGAGELLGNQNRPTHILLPFDLESAFIQIDGAPWLPGSANNDANPHHRKYKPVYVRNWTDSNNWAMLAKYDNKSPIHLIWLQGRRTPELFEATDEMAASMFTNDELRYKVRQFGADFDATYPVAPVADWRNVHKSNVA